MTENERALAALNPRVCPVCGRGRGRQFVTGLLAFVVLAVPLLLVAAVTGRLVLWILGA